MLIGFLNGATLLAEDDEDHDPATTTSGTGNDTAGQPPGGKTAGTINGRSGSSKGRPTLSEALVDEMQKLKVPKAAAVELLRFMDKDERANLDPEGFNNLVKVFAEEFPNLLTETQARALQDLYRRELSAVDKDRGKQFATALQAFVDKFPADKKPGDGDPKAAAAGDPKAPPGQADVLKKITDTIGEATKQIAAAVGQTQKGQEDFLKKAIDTLKGEDAEQDKGLRDLLKGLDKRKGEEAKNDKNETPTDSSNSDSGNNNSDTAKKDDKKDNTDKLLDALKDQKKDRGNASTPQNSPSEEKKEKKEPEKKEGSPSSSKKDDPPPPRKPSPTPTTPPVPSETPAPETAAAPEGPPPKMSSLPVSNSRPDSGRFQFNGGASIGGPAPMPGGGAQSGGAVGFEDSVFQVGGGDMSAFYGGEMGGGRRQGSSAPGYAAPPSGPAGDEGEEGEVDAAPPPPGSSRSRAPTEIVVSPPGEPNPSPVFKVGTLLAQPGVCDGDFEVGVCKKIEEQRQLKTIRENAGLGPAKAGVPFGR